MNRCRLFAVVACSLVVGCGDDSPVGGGGSGGSDTGGGGESTGGMNVGAGGEGAQGGEGGAGAEGGEGGVGGESTGGAGGSGGGEPQLNCEPVQNGVIDDTCGVFVNAALSDGGTGTKLAPFNNLTDAAASIASIGGNIYVCLEPMTAPQTISGATEQLQVYGGMNCTSWTWTAMERSEISVCVPGVGDCAIELGVPLRIENAKVRLERLAVVAPDAFVASASSIALIAHFSEVDMVESTVIAGKGQAGADGQDGLNGAAGGPGAMGVATSPINQVGSAAGGVSPCGVGGGLGGGVGGFLGSEFPTQGGVAQSNQGSNGNDAIDCVAGGMGVSIGVNGANGTDGSGVGSISSAGYVGVAGQPGTAGANGGGGGGGGRRYYTNGSLNHMSKGGGGGAGGCGGQPGTAGGAGGSSFAILSSSSSVTLDGTTVSAADGGDGGTRGDAGVGGAGGAAGPGGSNFVMMSGGGIIVLDGGCNGGAGRAGGAGGMGGAGAGGHSAAIAWVGIEPTLLSSNDITVGPPGFGTSSASSGQSMQTIEFP